MVIRKIRYIKSCIGTDPIMYDGKFQVAFIGRSNVGKSSTINVLAGKEIARSSKHPGRTKKLDFFLANESFYVVDLPGYGYAKVSEDQREKLRKMILWYLLYAQIPHRLVALIIDISVGLMPFDIETISMFREHKIPFIVIANKMDKVSAGEKQKRLDDVHTYVGREPVIPFSAKMGTGREDVLGHIFQHMLSKRL